MGWFDTKNKHQQVIVNTDAGVMQKIGEMHRRRRWRIIFNVIAIIFLVLGAAYMYLAFNYKAGLVYILIGLVILLLATFKKWIWT